MYPSNLVLRFVVCAVAIGLSVTVAAAAETKTVVASLDNTLYEDDNGTISNGVGEHMFVGRLGPPNGTPEGLIRRAVVRFPVKTVIPQGSTIISVTLRLYMSQTFGATTTQTITVHRVQKLWGEGTSNAPQFEETGTTVTVNDATWVHTTWQTTPTINDLWSNAGGDFEAASSTSFPIGGVGEYSFPTTSQMVADVQYWLDEPGVVNFGWLLKSSEASADNVKRFDTRERALTERRPMLTIEYDTITPVEGGSMGELKKTFEKEPTP